MKDCEVMKNITVSVDDETFRLAQAIAEKGKTSVSSMHGEYLKSLTTGTDCGPRSPEKTLSEVIADLRARGGGISVSDNLTREELYDRNAIR